MKWWPYKIYMDHLPIGFFQEVLPNRSPVKSRNWWIKSKSNQTSQWKRNPVLFADTPLSARIKAASLSRIWCQFKPERSTRLPWGFLRQNASAGHRKFVNSNHRGPWTASSFFSGASRADRRKTEDKVLTLDGLILHGAALLMLTLSSLAMLARKDPLQPGWRANSDTSAAAMSCQSFSSRFGGGGFEPDPNLCVSTLSVASTSTVAQSAHESASKLSLARNCWSNSKHSLSLLLANFSEASAASHSSGWSAAAW